MADFSNSSNMSLPIPTVGTAPGPEWATLLDSCLTILDGHSHVPGSGVQITSAALNINADLSMGGNSLLLTKSMQLVAQSSPPASGSLYRSGVNLYYVDGNGANIPLTNAGTIAGASGSISGLDPTISPFPSAAYVSLSSTFVWQSGTNIAANMDFASAVLRNSSPNSTYALTLSPPDSLGVNYGLTLPTLPSSNSFMALSTTGVMSATVPVSHGITRANLAALGQVVSSSSGGFSTSSAPIAVTNLSCAITTSGRPVVIMLVPDGSGNSSAVGPNAFNAGTGNASGTILVNRDGSPIARSLFQSDGEISETNIGFRAPPGTISAFDVVGAGSYVYTVSVGFVSNSTTFYCTYCKLVVYEL